MSQTVETEKPRAQHDVESTHSQHEAGSDKGGFVQSLENSAAPGYAMDRNKETAQEIAYDDDNNPWVHHQVCP